jgi:translation elongation factor EF-1alpha
MNRLIVVVFIVDSIETLKSAYDMIKNKETKALVSLEMNNKLKWIPKGTKVTRVERMGWKWNASKIRPHNETEVWVCPDRPLVPCD